MRILLSFILVALATPASADILNVPGDFPTIQAAIDAAQDGDEIVLAPGTYESPGILVDRSITLTIRSTDPDDPAVVAATVLADQDDAGVLTVRGDSAGVNIELTVDGVTFVRPADQTAEPLIDIEGAVVGFSRCRFDGGDATTPSGGMVVSDESPDERQSFVSVRSCEFFGDVGELSFNETDLRWIDVTLRDGNGNIRSESRGLGLSIEDASFERLDTAAFAAVRAQHFDNGEVSIAHTGFTDVRKGGIEAENQVVTVLEDVSVLRCGDALAAGSPFIHVDGLVADGLTVRDCHVSIADGGGGWFVDVGDTLVARNLLFENNSGSDILLHAATDRRDMEFLIEDAVFRSNTVADNALEAHGSGIYRRCTFEHNTILGLVGGFPKSAPLAAWGQGSVGAMYPGIDILVEDCRFMYNRGGVAPFAITKSHGDPVVLRRCVFEGNTGVFAGAVSLGRNNAFSSFTLNDPWVHLDNCTIVGNTGGYAGSHLGTAIYTNCTVANNVGVQAELGLAPAWITDSVIVTTGTLPTVTAAVDQDPANSEIVSSHSIVPPDAQGTSTTSLAPLFVRPPNDGGDGWGDDPTTPDIDESLNDDFGDLRLQPGSPAIDAGSRGISRFFETDLAGNDRLRDDPGIPDDGRNGKIDIGAYEFQGTTCLPDVNGDGNLTPNDFNAWVLAFNENSPLADQNRDGRVTPNDFNAWIINYNAGC